MRFLKSWNDFEAFRDNSRKLVIFGVNDDGKRLIQFFENEIDFLCDLNNNDSKTIKYNGYEFPIISLNELSFYAEPLDIVISTNYDNLKYIDPMKNFKSIISITDNFNSEIYLYFGKKNEYLTHNDQRLGFDDVIFEHLNKIKNIYSDIDIPLHEYFYQINKEQLIANENGLYIDYNKNVCMQDFIGKYTNHLFGKRVTVDQPKCSHQNIYIFGDSRAYGYWVEDKFTFASLLQRMINKSSYKIKVMNYAFSGLTIVYNLHQISSMNLTSNDTVVLCISFSRELMNDEFDIYVLVHFLKQVKNKCISHKAKFICVNLATIYDINEPTELEEYIKKYLDREHKIKQLTPEIKKKIVWLLKENSIYLIDTVKWFNKPRIHFEIFRDGFHYLNSGNQLVAEMIFNQLAHCDSKNYTINIEDGQANEKMLAKYRSINMDLNKLLKEAHNKSGYLNYVDIINKQNYNISGIIGAIVVNCNPFTNGHLKLIEYASFKVDYLYIFVIEEDGSYFSFEDRLYLTKENTRHIKNVIVIPSGRYVISKITFPDYFDKENKSDIMVDCHKDLLMFGSIIAPALNITKRFIGNEPFCNVTRQYNEQMKEILPIYDIDVLEIERFSINYEYISASRVRELFENRDFYSLKDYVPKITYKYLIAK